jgi:16S rRNA (cytosine967-C5)-methyltransferase
MKSARDIAARVVARTLGDGAYAAAVLEAELERSDLDARDRAFATELVLGTLRVFPWLEERIASHAARRYEQATIVRAHLAVAAYQLFFLRTPAHAAVDGAVRAVRAGGHPEVAGFANAVLRKLAAEALKKDPERRVIALRASTPEWLREALFRSLGDRTDAFLAEGPPPVGLRVERGERDVLIERLREERPRASFEKGRVSPLAILARGAGRIASLRAYAGGEVSIQEEGSQVVALAVGAKPDEHVLDACAGRGGKTAILARMATVDACDLHASKLERLARELGRLGLRATTHVFDWTQDRGSSPRARTSGTDLPSYDRVLVDAPCSGSGTLRRRPDIALRRTPEDVADLASLQLAIVSNAAKHVRPGGRLVYAVCSVLREEGEEVADRFLAACSGFRAAPFDADLPVLHERCRLLLTPMDHGTDGYFLASFVRVG